MFAKRGSCAARMVTSVAVADRSGTALDCAQPERRFTWNSPVDGSMRIECVQRQKPPNATRETRKAREDAMPHERGSMPVLPSEFSNRYSRRSQSSLLLLAAAATTRPQDSA